jgi:hypothetical protein
MRLITTFLFIGVSLFGQAQKISKIPADTTISVQWLGLSCFCPNWIEYQYVSQLKNDSLGKLKDQFAIAIQPSEKSTNLYDHPMVGNQTPLTFNVKGRYLDKPLKHEAKGLSYVARTFEYDEFILSVLEKIIFSIHQQYPLLPL